MIEENKEGFKEKNTRRIRWNNVGRMMKKNKK